jgi:Flp pilus assembly protein TadD
LSSGTVLILNEPKESLNTLRSALGQVSGQHSKITNQPNPDQDCSEIHYWLGRMLYENSDSAHAVSELRLATDQDPANAAAYYYLGQALRSLMKQELVAEAEKAFHTYLDFGAPLGYQQELQELWKERNSQEIQ